MLRIATAADIPAMLDIYGPYVLTSTATFEYEVPTATEFRDRFDSITTQYPWLVWEEDGNILGYAYASAPYSRAAYAWCAEPSIYLNSQARGRGIGTAVLRRCLAQGKPVYLYVFTGNVRAVALYEREGFRKVEDASPTRCIMAR